VAAKSWLVPGCSPWSLPNPGWFQDAAGNREVTVGVAAVSVTSVN
jgi:hypothetical protein